MHRLVDSNDHAGRMIMVPVNSKTAMHGVLKWKLIIYRNGSRAQVIQNMSYNPTYSAVRMDEVQDKTKLYTQARTAPCTNIATNITFCRGERGEIPTCGVVRLWYI
jgi:hypothetical protein